MLRFSGEQLSLIQAALAPPVPQMVAPPQLVPVVMTSSGCPPASASANAPHSHHHHYRRPCEPPAEPPPLTPDRRKSHLPLALLLPSYLLLAGAGLFLSVGGPTPSSSPPCAPLLVSPWLGLTVAAHALAVPHSPAAQALGLLFALLHPAAAWLGGLEGALGAGLALSLFLTLSVPARCGRRAFALLGLALVAIAAALSPMLGGTPSGARSLLGLVLTGLTLQAVVGATRLRASALRASVVDDNNDKPDQTPRPFPSAIGL